MGFKSVRMPVSSITVVCLLLISMWVGVMVVVPEPVVSEVHNTGTISGDVTWLAANNPHIVKGFITVNGNLTLEPGVLVKINDISGLTSFLVNGRLNVNGTVNKPIIFTSNTTSPSKGNWGTIAFLGTAKAYLHHCIINYSSTGINCQSSNVIINNSIIKNCNTGISISNNANPSIFDNNIFDCTSGITIGSGSPTILNNTINESATGILVTAGSPTFYDNTINDTTTSISISGGSSIIYNNTINDTTTGILVSAGSPYIYNNNVSNCTSAGIEVSGSTAKIHDNEIYLCQKGAYLKSNTAFEFYENTLNSCKWSFYTENTVTIHNCTIINSTENNFYLTGATYNVYTLNMSYNDSNYVASNPKLYKQWYLHAHVEDNFGADMPGANVTVAPNGGTAHTHKTHADGWARWIRCTEKEYTNSGTTNRFPHDASATDFGYNTTVKTLTINISKTLYFTIKDIRRPSSSVSAQKFWYNVPSVNLNFQANDNANLQDISLYYNYSSDDANYNAAAKTNSTSISGDSDSGAFIFNFTDEGYYQFYTLAKDKTGNIEVEPPVRDEQVGYDTTSPVFVSFEADNVTEDTLYPCRINVTISESLSGIMGNPWIRCKYDSTNTTWDINYTQMTKYSRNSRGEVMYYYEVPDPLPAAWDDYQGKYLAWEINCSDKAGNSAKSTLSSQTKELIDYVDHEPSVVVLNPKPNKWYNHTILIRCEAYDNEDIGDPLYGIAVVNTQYSLDSTDGVNGTWTDGPNCTKKSDYYEAFWSSVTEVGTDDEIWIRARSKDLSDLFSSWRAVKIKVDNEPAESTNDYDELWHNEDFSINLSASDGTATGVNGSGVKHLIYKINNGTSMDTELDGMPKITTEGDNNTIEYWSIDQQNNVERHKFLYEIKLDKTKPTIEDFVISNITIQTAADADVHISTNISDFLSGLKAPKFRFKLPGENNYGAWQTMELLHIITSYSNVYRGKLMLPTGKQWADYSGGTILFEISCSDIANNEAVVSASELVDAVKGALPVILHTPVTTAEVGEDITITATIMDDESITNAQLFYSVDDKVSFFTTSMVQEGMTDTYSSKIPAQQQPGTVYYYLRAQDNMMNVVTEPELDPETNAFEILVDYLDADGDDLPDNWEVQNFGSIESYGAEDDPDKDGLSNADEFYRTTDPMNGDTDGDGLPDGWEVKNSLDPNDSSGDNGANGDPDKDGYSNLEEYKNNTKPMDSKSKPKESEPTDLTAVYAGIIVVVVIIILLLSYLMLRGRGALAGEAGKGEVKLKPGAGAKPAPETEEEDMDLELDTLKPEPGKKLDKMEALKLSRRKPCMVCLRMMKKGDTAVKCKCGLVLDQECAAEMKKCPECGSTFDWEQMGISAPIKKTKSKPVIRGEVKQEIEELVKPPETVYFAYIPELVKEKKITDYFGAYFKARDLGKPKTDKNVLNNVSLFIAADSAKIMLDHCYDQGRENEVMGLMLGKTYQYGDNIVSIVKDVVTSELDATEVKVRFDSHDKLFDQMDKLTYDYQIIGWYHSHPNYSSFMSPTDVETQKRMFKHPHQYAVVIDPIRYEMKAFVYDKSAEKENKERGYAIVKYKEV